MQHCILSYPLVALLFLGTSTFTSSASGSSPGSDGIQVAKNDLIAELKLSHNVGGVSKLRSEQAKLIDEEEKQKYKRFLAQFTMENFLETVRKGHRGRVITTL